MDEFTIMRTAGHSSITISQRYEYSSIESLERAFERLDAFNSASKRKREMAIAEAEGLGLATIENSATDLSPVSINQSRTWPLSSMVRAADS